MTRHNVEDCQHCQDCQLAATKTANLPPPLRGGSDGSVRQAVTSEQLSGERLGPLDQLLSDLDLPPRPAWMAAAACRGLTHLFFPERGEDARPAKTICTTCPVRPDCLDHAITTSERAGIYGGTSARERRRNRATNHTEQEQA